jgi:hypothetical protein
MTKGKPLEERDLEIHPDAWERFEKAFDTVMKAKPKPMPARKDRTMPSPKRGGTGEGTKSA